FRSQTRKEKKWILKICSKSYKENEAHPPDIQYAAHAYLRISDIFATVTESSLKTPETIFSASSPLTGSTSSLDLTASAKKSLSFVVSLKALRSICTRCLGVTGGTA